MRYLLLLGLFLLVSLSTTAQAAPDLERIKSATVFILQTRTVGGQTVITCVGSGTIVNRSGLIATNAHNTVPNSDCMGDDIVIALSVDPTEPPTPTYRAEIAQANVGLDLALLRITQELNGRFITPGTLALPFVELGDSSQLALDETITVVGYPGIGSEPVASTRGTITSFIAEPSGGERSWIKTDATIPGTMTGGGVYNQRGQLIGVPTTVPVVTLNTGTSCIALEDTNSDGLVNNNDSCVPTGGFINALRPSNFVRPLLRGASLGLSVEKLTGASFQITTAAGQPAFSQLIVAPSVTQGMPGTVARNLPSGTNNFYLFFDYANMTPETIYELRVSVDGIPNPTYSLAPVRWSGGTNGLWYIGIGTPGLVLPNGTYEFTLSINGLVSATNTIIVGVAPEMVPSFTNIIFCIEAGTTCFGDVYVLPTGTIVSARFVHRNVPVGIPWTALWFYNGVELTGARVDGTWAAEPLDTKTIRLESEGGLPPGHYRLQLYLDGRLAALSSFTITGANQGAFSRVFSNARFASSLDNAAGVQVSISSFPNTAQAIYALFDWELLAPGTLWRMRWLVDGAVFYDEIVPWAGAESGSNFTTVLTGQNGIPDGAYTLELYINDVQIDEATIEAEVGIGQLAIDPFAQVIGVQMTGQIIDAETGEGLPGISFILISEEFSVADFEWNQEQVYAMAVTDRNGRFQLDRLLAYDAPYSVIIQANGYIPIKQDGIIVDTETANPIFVQIPLIRDLQ